jgi:hypothetical protein
VKGNVADDAAAAAFARPDAHRLIVLAICVAAGTAATFAAAAPTARPAVDAVMRGLGVGLIVLVGSRAPWWLVGGAAGVALAIAGAPELMVAAAASLALAWAAGTRPIPPPALLAASMGISFNVMIRAQLGGFFGLSALIVGPLALVVLIGGLGGCSRRTRWLVAGAAGLIALFAVTAAASTAYAIYTVRHELSGGIRAAELGVAAMEAGDVEEAIEWFRVSAASLATAHEALDQPWTWPAAAVPVLAQHRDVSVTMTGAGATGAATVVDALARIDLDVLRLQDGQLDIDAVAALDEPLREARAALDALSAATAESRSPWLIGAASYQLDDFEQSTREHVASLDNALRAIDDAPAMLGANGPRRYLLLFTTPAESRGLGGFVGSYAELIADDGQLTLEAVGQARDLDTAALAAGARVHGHDEFLDQYGAFGFDTDGDGAVGDAAFRNLAMTPNFPWVGEIAADLYEQTTGRHVDGVIAVDPMVIQELLRYTGAIHLSSFDQDLNADNAFGFLLHDQYVLGAGDNDRREDALADAAAATFQAMLDGALPDPIKLSTDMGWLVEQRHLLFWSAHPAEQRLLASVHATGALPNLDGANGWAFTVSNGGGNKIDTYLQRRASFQTATDSDGRTTSTLRIELTNTAPDEGLPAYVIGNRRGLPPGTSRLYLSVYSPLGLAAATLDDQPLAMSAGTEQGWNVYSRFVDIPPGATVTLEVRLEGVVDDLDRVVTWEQPMASPLEVVG